MPTDPILLGVLLGLGVTLIAIAFTTPTDDPARAETVPAPVRRNQPALSRQAAAVVGAGLAVGAVVWAVFHLPVLTVAAVAAVIGPRHLAGRAADDGNWDPARIAETASTVARWIETVRDYLLTAATLNEAMIQASADVHGPHRDAFTRFAATLTSVGGYNQAAADLAVELDNALADKAFVALWIGNRGGGDLHEALGLLAEAAQAEADAARRIEASLAGNRRLVKIVLVLCALILALSLIAFRENFDIYRTLTGQAILATGLALIGTTWWSIWRLSKVALPERLIAINPRQAAPW
jgi:Flp pilus assembly protein TadB